MIGAGASIVLAPLASTDLDDDRLRDGQLPQVISVRTPQRRDGLEFVECGHRAS
jgi:hypothetical protein